MAPYLRDVKGEIALYDVAIHNNLGDPIWFAAAARLVAEFHRSTTIICAETQFQDHGSHDRTSRKHFPHCSVADTIEAIGQDGVILLQAGGNWGDLWWSIQAGRNRYLEKMGQFVKNGTAKFQVRAQFLDEGVLLIFSMLRRWRAWQQIDW